MRLAKIGKRSFMAGCQRRSLGSGFIFLSSSLYWLLHGLRLWAVKCSQSSWQLCFLWICLRISSVQLLSCVRLFVTPWTEAPQASLCITIPEYTKTHVHCVSDAFQKSHPLLSPSPSIFNLSQHQGLSKWVSTFSQVAKALELQLQRQSLQWIFGQISFRMDWLGLSAA